MKAAEPTAATRSTPLLLSPIEAALTLGISRSTLYELMAKGLLRSVRIGRARRICHADVERLSDTGASLKDAPARRRKKDLFCLHPTITVGGFGDRAAYSWWRNATK
jgi:excisionase family DNA binding protein